MIQYRKKDEPLWNDVGDERAGPSEQLEIRSKKMMNLGFRHKKVIFKLQTDKFYRVDDGHYLICELKAKIKEATQEDK